MWRLCEQKTEDADMANRDPRPGDRAMILPMNDQRTDGDNYVGTICRVGEADWEPRERVLALLGMLRIINPGSKAAPRWDIDKPFWRVELYDGSVARIHNDYLEPIDPDAEEEEREREKGVLA